MKVSIVISAYNEEKTLVGVLRSCRLYNPEAEIVVVDDGSKDATPKILKELEEELGYRYFILEENKGKSYAMAYGVEQSEGEIILFFDADLTGIKQEHFDLLLQPMLQKEADMVLGQPSVTLIDYRVNPFRSLTGERAMRKKDLLPILDDIRDIRFGVETFINLLFQARGRRIHYVLLEGLNHPTKYQKTSALKATKEFVSEGQEIATTMIDNYDLILQRVDYLIGRANKSVKVRATKLQRDITKQIMRIKAGPFS